MDIAATSSSSLSSHALDTTLGKPASGMPVALSVHHPGEEWRELAQASTNADGRVTKDNFPRLIEGPTYRVRFDTTTYFQRVGVNKFLYPYVDVVFRVEVVYLDLADGNTATLHRRRLTRLALQAGQHYHIPLLVSAHGYSTYRGS